MTFETTYPRPDPQAALLDLLTEDQLLDMLGPSWAKMTAPERHAYAFPGRKAPLERHTLRRRWWEAA